MEFPKINSLATCIRLPDIHNIKSKDDLNEQAGKLQNFFMTQCSKEYANTKIKKKGPNAQKHGPADKNNKEEIQGLYYNQKHRAVQEILLGPTSYCEIDPDTIEKHYRSLLGSKQDCHISDLPPFLWNNAAPKEKDNKILEKEITPGEVRTKLCSKIYNILYSSRSVGLDRLSFKNLFTCDKNCTILAAFYNACLRLGMIPDIWKSLTYSVLVKEKVGDADNIKNWRLVTMHTTIVKLFYAIVTSRLITWAKSTNRLSATQKGFLMDDAACESCFILQETKNYALKNGKDLAVAWLDFTNASDFLPKESLLHALRQHLVPLSMRNIVQNTFQNSQTRIRTKSEAAYTNSIEILSGLPQGLSLNFILLDLVIEPILRNLSAQQSDKFQIFNEKMNHFVIPNELTLIASSAASLQNLLDSVEKTSKAVGLKFNINKCSTYYYNSEKNEIQNVKFSFCGQKLQVLPDAKINEYFGVKQGLSIGQDGAPTIKEMIASIENIDSSALTEYQKLESVHTFIIPRVENYLRGLQDFDMNYLQEVDQFLQNKIKSWLHLPIETVAEVIVFHVADLNLRRSIAFLPFIDLLYIMKIIHALEIFNSNDQVVKKIAHESIMREVSEAMHNTPNTGVTKKHLCEYLSGDLYVNSNKSNSIWEMARSATMKLKVKIDLLWKFKKDEMQIIVINNKRKEHIFTGDIRSELEKHLKNSLVEFYMKDAKKKKPESAQDIRVVKSHDNKTSINQTDNGSNEGTSIEPDLKIPIVEALAALKISTFPPLHAP